MTPTPTKTNYTKAKAYHPHSPLSFLLHPLHRYQFAYQLGKYPETALHCVTAHTEEAVANNEVTLASFLDIDVAFDCTSHIITKAAKLHELEDNLLVDQVQAWQQENKSHTLEGPVARRHLQGGILLPLLCSLFVH